MTIFDLGDLITLLVSSFLVLYFRAHDSNNRSVEEARRLQENLRRSLDSRYKDIVNELEERAEEMQGERDLNIEFMKRGAQSYRDFSESVRGLESAQQHLDSLFASVQQHKKELGHIEQRFRKVDEQTEQIYKLDTHLKEQRNWAGKLQKHLQQNLEEHQAVLQEALQSDVHKYLAVQKKSWAESMVEQEKHLHVLAENISQQVAAMQKVSRARTEWDKIERSLQEDAEHFRQSQQVLRQKLQDVSRQHSQIEDKISSQQKQLNQSMEQLTLNCEEVQQELDRELERHRQELRQYLERDVQNLQHERQSLLRQETEILLQQSGEQVQQRLQEFEQWCSAYFEKFADVEDYIKRDRKILLEQFRRDMQVEMEALLEKYRQQSVALFGDWGVLAENFQILQLDLKNIEGRSRTDLTAQFELYEKSFADDLRQKQVSLRENLQLWDENLKRQLAELEQHLEDTQQDNLQHNREVWNRQIELERRELKEQLRLSKQHVQGQENEAEREIRDFMVKFRAETKVQQEEISQQNRECAAEIRQHLAEHASELGQWSQKFQQVENNIQERSSKLEEQYETLDSRMQTDVQQMSSNFVIIEKQQQHVLSNSKLIERAEQLWRETNDKIAKLREHLASLHTYGEQTQHLEKEFEYIRQLAQDLDEKLGALKVNEERTELLQQNVDNLGQTLEQTSAKWEALSAQNDRIKKMEEHLQRIAEVYRERGQEFLVLEEQAQNLETHQVRVLQDIRDIKDLQSRLSSVEQLLGPLEEKARELHPLQVMLEKNSVHIDKAVAQIPLLQELLDKTQQRSEELHRLRSWLLKAEQRVKEISTNLDANIQQAEQVVLQQSNPQNLHNYSADLTHIDEERRTMVFQLAEKGWDNTAIAKHINISVGAVELILEMKSMT